MTAAAIEVRGLCKRYRLGPRVVERSVRQVIADAARAPLRQLTGRAAPPAEEFWALDDVAFSAAPGEAVGIIGRNGAGKSTLLKILSRITAPTRGEVRLRGQVASLLEIGTGFHSELTGRENIFLNGAILGMKRAEIRARFDEIVAFAEIDQFLDTPVKRYSSGMYVRLAFAVAAHLQPEILVVDEVLAVGDRSFQQKCLGKLENVATGGRTVLFVSHNLGAISRLCRRALLLERGKLVLDGPVSEVIGGYLGGGRGATPTAIDFRAPNSTLDRAPASEDVRLLAARLVGDGLRGATADIRRPLRLEIDYQVLRQRHALHPVVHVYNDEQVTVLVSNDSALPEARAPREPGCWRATLEIPGNFLAEGLYTVDLTIATMEPSISHVLERAVISFQVHDPGEGDSARGLYAGPYPGVVRPLWPWTTQRLPEGGE